MRPLVSSYRARLPLALSATAVCTAVLMALALGLQTLHNLRAEQGHRALHLGHAMAALLVSALRQDDVWLAYSLLRGPDDADSNLVWVLTDAAGRVFASNRPRRYRLDQPLAQVLPGLAQAHAAKGSHDGAQGRPVRLAQSSEVRRLIHLPLESEGTQVGDLFALLSDRPFLERFHQILLGGVLVTAAVLALLLPVGWFWGRRMVAPLVHLADCMGRVGRDDPRTLDCRLPSGDDEIGRLGRCFREMLAALAEKAELEQRMLRSERLAAVGRVSAGVAHEINNPLGGMVMAIDTYRGDVPSDERTARLLDLLDRGLHQIQETVSALLVEARADRRVLTQADLDDVRTLAEPRLTRSGVPLTWQVRFEAEASLPAAPVRQLLLNLVLNALDAAGAGGSAAVRVESAGGSLCLEVENTGRPLPPERRDHPFEPFPSPPGGRSGLGLWVCYQIVSQLHGTIEIRSHGDLTRVEVRLPLHPGGEHG